MSRIGFGDGVRAFGRPGERSAGRVALGDYAGTLERIDTLPAAQRPALWARLDKIRRISHNLGYGVGDDLDELLAEHGVDG